MSGYNGLPCKTKPVLNDPANADEATVNYRSAIIKSPIQR